MISSMLSSERKILEPFKILIEAEYVRSRLWKQHTWNRKPLDPSFKLAATLRHLDSGAKYSDIKYSWQDVIKTLALIVRDVWNAMFEEYLDDVMTYHSHLKNGNYWHGFYKKWNFAKLRWCHWRQTHSHQKACQLWFLIVYVCFFSSILLACVDLYHKYVWCDLGVVASLWTPGCGVGCMSILKL